MSQPCFSVIVPVYNTEDFLNDCINSVLNQNYSDFELLLIDDGSTDNSLSICNDYAQADKRVRAFHIENGGASKARNFGLDKAVGKYIIFLDSDDFWDNDNALNSISKKIDDTGCEILLFGCTDWNTITNEKKITRNDYDMDILSRNDKQEALHYLFSNKLLPGGVCIFAVKRSLVEECDAKFKEGVQAEDYDWVLNVFCNCSSISAINEPFYIYRKGSNDSVTARANPKLIDGTVFTIKKWIKEAELFDNELKKDIFNYLAFIYSTGIIIIGRMNRENRKASIKKMKPLKYILNYGYWHKVKYVRYFINIFGFSLTSRIVNRVRNIFK